MNYDIESIKALDFEHRIDLMWFNDDTKPMDTLLEMMDIGDDRDDLMDFGLLLIEKCFNNFNTDEMIKKMNSFIPLDKENLFADCTKQTCLNKECQFYHSDREPSCYTIYGDCWVDIILYIYMAFKIGGLSALKEIEEKWGIDKDILDLYYEKDYRPLYEKELYKMNLPVETVVNKFLHQDITRWIKKGDKYFTKKNNLNYNFNLLLSDIMKEYDLSESEATQYIEENFTNKTINEYGVDKMNKPFFMALSELKGTYDDISVFWTDNMMYVNDNDDNQAQTNTSLFQAYKFALLIQTPNFDYVASDEDVKHFHEELLECYKDSFKSDAETEHYIVNVWDYLDNVAEDYYKLTGVLINDIDFKRAIVSYMSETDLENECGMGYGSATYIARLLSDHIIGDDRNNVKKCNNDIAIKLAEKYLSTDTYDLHQFATALHKATKNVSIKINGALWINCAKYEYVDEIKINTNEVLIYRNNSIIGSIERENINTIEEQFVETGVINNLEDSLNFDIKKVGDF